MLRFPFSLLLTAGCGASWMLPIHWLGPLLSLLFIGLVLLQQSRITRYLVAFSYYAAGSVGLLRGVAVFFDAHAPMWEGAFLWLGSAALLSAGWAFVDRPWKAALVLLLDALPPLGLFDWLSPLSSAGVLFPGMGLSGLVALGVLFLMGEGGWWLRTPKDLDTFELKLRRLAATTLLGISILSNSLALLPRNVPQGWQGVDLDVGEAPQSILANQTRHAAILQEVLAASGAPDTKVVLLPESLETDWAGNVWAIQRAIPKGQIWLVGMNVPRRPGLVTDSIVALRHQGPPRVLFNSTFPVPVSMWHPWLRGTGYTEANNVGYSAAWWTPARNIEGIRAWASICYDQLLPFVWIEGVLQNPQVILLTNNEWWAQGTGIPVIQANTSWAWGRLIGAPAIEAENA
ncbi:conjugal transfer protein TraB [Acidithiobacillus sp. IBUN Pt1247-S3]|uniref:conjugal transfer protein TraB n=1 Tax=Acidithiobacillus sp. IBUN Pt1247-S3 TaxID=3166642 RepID=UPI0034E4081D